MTSRVSRAALVATLAIGASGLVAVSAEAAPGVSTANYYVNNPNIGAASDITPESATVSAAIDTGGSPEQLLFIPSTGLTWNSLWPIVISAGEKWNDGTTQTGASPLSPNPTMTGDYVPVDGLPVSGASSDVSVTITDSKVNSSTLNADSIDDGSGTSGTPFPASNDTADNYSSVTFEYDPVADYDANGDFPGSEVAQAPAVAVPTSGGVTQVSTTIGAFGQAAQTNTGNEPLKPGTKYYYWVVQQAGVTDQAVDINIAAWADTGGYVDPGAAAVQTALESGSPTAFPLGNVGANGPSWNPAYKCYPVAAIEQDADLDALYKAYLAGQNPQVVYPDSLADALTNTTVSKPAIQSTCNWYYGNTGGAAYYQSPNGEFTTPKIGDVEIGPKAVAVGKATDLKLTDQSAYKASGTIDLTIAGKLIGFANFHVAADSTAYAKIDFTKAGAADAKVGNIAHVAPISQVANIYSTSNWDQPFVGHSVKL